MNVWTVLQHAILLTVCSKLPFEDASNALPEKLAGKTSPYHQPSVFISFIFASDQSFVEQGLQTTICCQGHPDIGNDLSITVALVTCRSSMSTTFITSAAALLVGRLGLSSSTFASLSLLACEHEECQGANENILHIGIIIHDDCDLADIWKIPA